MPLVAWWSTSIWRTAGCAGVGEYSGGNSGWETWDLRPVDGGALATVEMEVVPAGGAWIRVAANLFVQRPLRRNVRQSLENLKRLVESESASA